ncbi:hypothetical protein CHS0354_005089 [Potamilus streckersoni]|uniref:Inactive hydroxysteroid dehydrogenase-like protein 1 n=1 Tax=Potamilus streckersoni TaxID=2493646 RepID=A0AAE0VV64_9BIVA|nr:hypothetical protein CHS0354_005089 [Potamilus streckersoni]
MAAAIDSFQFLLREIIKTVSHIRDSLALIGLLYVSTKTIKNACTLLRTLNDHALSRIAQSRNSPLQFGPWAVVTGSSEGIGKAYAQELASRGMNVVLISRGENRLYKTAKEIESQFHVQTCTIAVDFTAGREIYSKIWEKIKDKEIGILVNNVGVMYEYPQYFLDVPEERLWQIILVNVSAATMMTHMILPQMVERKRGAVVMVSSGACTKITPQMTVYAATKSFLDYFAKALQYEYQNSGIIIQSLRPFYVATKMTSYSETLSSHSFLVPPATAYARQAVATLGFTSRTTGYWPHTLQAWLCNIIPEGLWMWGASVLNTALRKQAEKRLKDKASIKSDDSMDNLQLKADIKSVDSMENLHL